MINGMQEPEDLTQETSKAHKLSYIKTLFRKKYCADIEPTPVKNDLGGIIKNLQKDLKY